MHFRRERRHLVRLISQQETRLFQRKNSFYSEIARRRERACRNGLVTYELAMALSQCLRTSTLSNTPLLNHRQVAQNVRAATLTSGASLAPTVNSLCRSMRRLNSQRGSAACKDSEANRVLRYPRLLSSACKRCKPVERRGRKASGLKAAKQPMTAGSPTPLAPLERCS